MRPGNWRPDELPNNFSDEARYLQALKLFEQGCFSSGKAGTLVDVACPGFVPLAGDTGEAALHGIASPLSRLVAASVLHRSGRLSPSFFVHAAGTEMPVSL